MHGGIPIQFLCRKFKSVRYISKKNRIFSFPAVLSGFSERCPHRAYLQKKCECNTFLVLFSKKLSIAYPSRLLSVLFSLPKIRKSVAIIEEKQKIAHHSTPLFTKMAWGWNLKSTLSTKKSYFFVHCSQKALSTTMSSTIPIQIFSWGWNLKNEFFRSFFIFSDHSVKPRIGYIKSNFAFVTPFSNFFHEILHVSVLSLLYLRYILIIKWI